MDMSVMSIRDGPSEEPIQGSYSISQESPWTLKALIKFQLLNNKGTKWQTLAKIAKNTFREFVLVEAYSKCYCVFAMRGQTKSKPCHFISAIHDPSSKEQMKCCMETVFVERPRSDRERLGCLFTICIQSPFVTVPCSSFSETTERDTRRRFHFWPLCYTNS